MRNVDGHEEFAFANLGCSSDFRMTHQFRAYSSGAYTVALPAAHKFPMHKYAGVRQALLEQGDLHATQVLDPPRAAWVDVERVHTPGYLHQLRFGNLEPRALRLLGFPWSAELVERALRAVGGTMRAAEDALGLGLGINLAGGTHHAYPDHGEGFCLLNDVAIAIKSLFEARRVSRVLVLDLDVHQGNGTAAIFANDPRVFTLSVHGERNYPFRKERSSLDLALPDGVSDAEYLALFRAIIPALEAFGPEIVFYLAGVDVLSRDQFGRFALTPEGVLTRDRCVFAWAKRSNTPIVSLMAGGYNKDHALTVAAHANTVRAALGVFVAGA